MHHNYHYTECGLCNIYLLNGYKFLETSKEKAVSINNIEGLHKVIGLFLINTKRDFTGNEVRFLRHEMLMSQNTLAQLLGMNEVTIRRWENGKINIPSPSASLLRLLYIEHLNELDGKISILLKKFSDLEESILIEEILFENTSTGWLAAA